MGNILIKEKAIAAWEFRKELDAKFEVEQKVKQDAYLQTKLIEGFKYIFGIEPDDVNGERIVHEGITFVKQDANYGLQIKYQPSCGCWNTYYIHNIEDFGRYLSVGNNECNSWNCPRKAVEPEPQPIEVKTSSECLIDALMQFIQEHSRQGEI